ncbi:MULTISPECIES: GntR family transcriptional regulator [unclassified Amycolatopsis]|uniref:GntR family transcriptional regulator n=1 Tax=unclassified Amycolatopsis TaxID=2618356 RepID=UPI001C6A2ED2|nr:GntR family transcriptional regulator [Amycolatopsis sp. DSM 110486]QYN20230.1 GntR family transcriptional regulator [Amycolatopsis sp. DSM 110486]
MPSTKSSTRAERVYLALRKDILAGRQIPGSRLPFAELCSKYDASMGVVREALSRLTAEGLVQAEPQLGFRTTPISVEDLEHLTEARVAIESLVLREALAQDDVRWESEVLAAHHRLQQTPQMDADDPDRISEEWSEAHATYHLALLSGCPNPRLLAIARSLRDSAELYRRWSVPLGHENRDITGEHKSILDAILAKDADLAVATLIEHIQHTTQVLLHSFDQPNTNSSTRA